jgi:UDP-sulfoquinovose synthase
MRILILGADGYLGWTLYQYLGAKHEVKGVDNGLRRMLVKEVGSDSLLPISDLEERDLHQFDISEWRAHDHPLELICREFQPEVIVHFAEQPSAPYSMRGRTQAHLTQQNNVIGTLNLLFVMREVCPEAHLIKLGTMGEYGDTIYGINKIPESSRMVIWPLHTVTDKRAEMKIPTPKWAGSLYHWSKVFDSYNIDFACKLWGLRATDLNQGIVYSTGLPGQKESTRFDYDECFGTLVNRFIVQALCDIPLTVYGAGKQTRGFIYLGDSMRAIELVVDHPPKAGELNVINQLTEVKSVLEIAHMVQEISGCAIESRDNPRVEKESHPYNPIYEKLKGWGLTKPVKMEDELPNMLVDVAKHIDKVKLDVVEPKTQWR